MTLGQQATLKRFSAQQRERERQLLEGRVAYPPTPAAPSCGTCRFYAQSECRRHAPAPNGRAGDARLRLFPVVDLAEWCGDYEATPCPH